MARNVVVTGGGTGIGRAVAASFAARGDTVVITGRRGEPLQRAAAALGSGVRAVVCDATDPTQVEALRAQLPASVDVLVNNAEATPTSTAPVRMISLRWPPSGGPTSRPICSPRC